MKPLPQGEPLCILVVEHDHADADLAIAAIERAGIAVTAHLAETPEELAARLDAGPYDLVLSDYRLPGWTAMDALAVLRARGDDTPVIIVTGTLGDEPALDCVKQGAADYVIKDNMTRLPVAVGRALEALRTEDLRPPGDLPAPEQYPQQPPPNVHAADSARHRKRDGTVFIAEINAHAVSWEGREAGMVVVHDVTERRRAEAELQAAKTRLEQLLALSNAVIYALKVEGKQFVPLWVSDNITRVLGFEPAEALDANWWLVHLHPDDGGRALAEGQALFAMGNVRHEYRFRLKDGTYRWILDEHRRVREASGGADVVGAWVVITDLKQAEPALPPSPVRS